MKATQIPGPLRLKGYALLVLSYDGIDVLGVYGLNQMDAACEHARELSTRIGRSVVFRAAAGRPFAIGDRHHACLVKFDRGHEIDPQDES